MIIIGDCMKYCTNCGSKLLENSRFCVKCGQEIYHIEPKKKEKDSVVFGIISYLCSMFLLLGIAVPICSKDSGIDKSFSKVLGIFLYVVLSILPLIMGIIGIVSGVGKLNGKDKKNNKGGFVLSIMSMIMLVLGFILLIAN